MESNKRVNSRTQSMVQNDFALLSHPSPLPLVSQGDKHHKVPMFYIHCTIYVCCLHDYGFASL